MPLASATGLLALALLTSADAAEPPPLPPCEAGVVRLVVEADAAPRVPALCITPELSTLFLFDAKLARVELEGREHFRRVSESADSFMVIPSEAMSDTEPLRVTVYFADGAAPASLTFLLVGSPSAGRAAGGGDPADAPSGLLQAGGAGGSTQGPALREGQGAHAV